jgi:hypothetical protein
VGGGERMKDEVGRMIRLCVRRGERLPPSFACGVARRRDKGGADGGDENIAVDNDALHWCEFHQATMPSQPGFLRDQKLSGSHGATECTEGGGGRRPRCLMSNFEL